MSTDAADNDQKPRDYGPPFDDSDADVIFRSSNLVDFYLYKNMLAKSSSVFRDMFSVPQPASDATGPRNLPIIPLSETAADLAMVLGFCYPLQRPDLTLRDASIVLRTAEKYAMDWLYREMKELLKQPAMAREDPVRVFALAWDMKLEDVARVAAKEYLRVELSLDSLLAGDELDLLPGPALRQLAIYHRACADIAKRQCVVEGSTFWALPGIVLSTVKGLIISTHQCSCNSQLKILYDGRTLRFMEWWASYMQEAARELNKRPWPVLVHSPELINAAHRKASRCDGCRENSLDCLSKFSQVFFGAPREMHIRGESTYLGLELILDFIFLDQVSIDLPFATQKNNP